MMSVTDHIKRVATSALGLAIVFAVTAGVWDKEIRITNRGDGTTLAGTLTMPADGKPKAAVILATGSGCQDRDETIGNKKPFRTIADSLARYGYASLRFDDRGAGDSGGDFTGATAATFLSDMKCMLAASDSLFADSVPTGIIGHSEGALTAVKAAGDSRCDFIVTLAGPAWQGDSIIMSQLRAIATAMTGGWEKESVQRRLLDICMLPLPVPTVKSLLYEALRKEFGEAATLPAVQQQIASAVESMTSRQYRDMLSYDPADDIRAVSKPWLALNGDVDMQVLPENLTTIAQLNSKADTLLLKGHNHLFQKGGTGMIDEYAILDGDISAECIAAIVSWLNKIEPIKR